MDATCFSFWYWRSGGPVKKTTLYVIWFQFWFLFVLCAIPFQSNTSISLFGMGASDLHISGTWKNVPICCDTPKEPKIPGGFLRVCRLFCRFYRTRVRSLHYRLSNGNYELKKKCLKVNIYFVLSQGSLLIPKMGVFLKAHIWGLSFL